MIFFCLSRLSAASSTREMLSCRACMPPPFTRHPLFRVESGSRVAVTPGSANSGMVLLSGSIKVKNAVSFKVTDIVKLPLLLTDETLLWLSSVPQRKSVPPVTPSP